MLHLLKPAFFGLLIGITGVVVGFFHFAHDLEENTGLSLLFKLRGIRKASSDVVIVGIDRESSERLGVSDNPNRWSRSLHARLVDSLAREGAQVIVYDMYFTESHSAEEDHVFAEAIKNARNVVLAEPLKVKEIPSADNGGSYASAHRIVQPVKPIALLAQSSVAMAPFVLPRMPVNVNHYWTFQTGAGDSPTSPVVAFQLYALGVYDEFLHLLEKVSPHQAGKLPRDADTAMKIRGAVRFIKDIREMFESDPLIAKNMLEELEHAHQAASDPNTWILLKSLIKLYGGADRRYLNHYGPPRTVTTIPFYRALRFHEDAGSDNRIDLKGKAVFVGRSELLPTEKEDGYYTVFSETNGALVGGVEIAATAFSNLLEDAPVKPISSYSYTLMIFAWGMLVGVMCRMASPLVAALGTVGVSMLYLVAANYHFKADGSWYPVIIPLFVQAPFGFFGAVLWSYVETSKERENIRRALGYYVPNEVAHQLATNVADMKKGGHTVYGACLFTDATGYTNLSETMDPGELSDYMHQYFDATFEPVKQNGGLVVDLKGDSILAIWKSARPEAALRKQACQAALDVAKAVSRFNRSFETLRLPTRVGVHAGQIFLGNIGAGDHYRYGPTGDTVNTASRIDSLNKHLGTEILVSDEVMHELDGFLTREVGTFRLKGKGRPLVIHELFCRMEEAEETQKEACTIFSEALRTFRQQAWDEAREGFCRAIQHSETDGPAHYYIRLCEQYKKNPPEEAWEGVIPMEDK